LAERGKKNRRQAEGFFRTSLRNLVGVSRKTTHSTAQWKIAVGNLTTVCKVKTRICLGSVNVHLAVRKIKTKPNQNIPQTNKKVAAIA